MINPVKKDITIAEEAEFTEIQQNFIKERRALLAVERDLIRHLLCPTANEHELRLLLSSAHTLQLNPLTAQICLMPFWDKKEERSRHQLVVQLNGMYAVASRAGDFLGFEDETQFGPIENETGIPGWSKAVALKAVGEHVARFPAKVFSNEIVNKNNIWNYKAKPQTMMGKCARAAALRMGWSDSLSGVYAEPEFQLYFGGPKEETTKEIEQVQKQTDKALERTRAARRAKAAAADAKKSSKAPPAKPKQTPDPEKDKEAIERTQKLLNLKKELQSMMKELGYVEDHIEETLNSIKKPIEAYDMLQGFKQQLGK